MKTSHPISIFSSKSLRLAVSVLLVLGAVLVVPAGTALAAGPADPSSRNLGTAYQHEQHWLTVQQGNLDLANGIATSVQDLITEAQARSIDTTAISAALTTFQSQISAAQSSHDSAASLLSTHNGFDDSGNVTDAVAAAQTVAQAGQALLNAHTILVQSSRGLLNALKAWEKANNILTKIDGLQVAYANEQAWLNGQETNLGKADTAATDVQNLITEAQADGLNTEALASALAAFQTKQINAQNLHATADAILSTHDGFDSNGKVTDATAAAATVKTAGDALMGAHNELASSSTKLMVSLDKWKLKNHITSASPVYATFHQARQAAQDLFNSVHVENAPHIASLDTRLDNLLKALLNELS